MDAFNSPYLAPPSPAFSVIPAKAGIHAAVAIGASAEWIPGQARDDADCLRGLPSQAGRSV